MFIVIEGADGCGKSTIAKLLAEELPALVFNFPNDEGYTGPIIREYLRHRWSVCAPGLSVWDEQHMGAMAFQALQVVNRLEVMPFLSSVEESLKCHAIAVRYWQSGWVYGGLDGLDESWLVHIHAGLAQPAVSILLDVDAECAARRRASRDGNSAPERYEGDVPFLSRVVERYRLLWRQQANTIRSRWAVVDARGSVEDTLAHVRSTVEADRKEWTRVRQ